MMMYLYSDCSLYLNRKADKAKQACIDFWELQIRKSNQSPVLQSNGTWMMQISEGRRTVRERGFITERDAISARDSFINAINIKRIKENDQWLMWQRQRIYKQFGMS